jgi:2,3-bisphosphoglycerate-dependent phosphoglycerate mutase
MLSCRAHPISPRRRTLLAGQARRLEFAYSDAPMSPPIRLFLARHGRTHWNHVGRFQGHSDPQLDEVGRAQAVMLAQTLSGRVQAVIASDLLRASETARSVADALSIPLLALDPDLRERCYGVFEGLTHEECNERHPSLWAARQGDREFVPPGGETRAVVVARMQRGLVNAVERVRGRYERCLVVAHGSSLRMFFEELTGQPAVSLANMEFRELLHDGDRFVLAANVSVHSERS